MAVTHPTFSFRRYPFPVQAFYLFRISDPCHIPIKLWCWLGMKSNHRINHWMNLFYPFCKRLLVLPRCPMLRENIGLWQFDRTVEVCFFVLLFFGWGSKLASWAIMGALFYSQLNVFIHSDQHFFGVSVIPLVWNMFSRIVMIGSETYKETRSLFIVISLNSEV